MLRQKRARVGATCRLCYARRDMRQGNFHCNFHCTGVETRRGTLSVSCPDVTCLPNRPQADNGAHVERCVFQRLVHLCRRIDIAAQAAADSPGAHRQSLARWWIKRLTAAIGPEALRVDTVCVWFLAHVVNHGGAAVGQGGTRPIPFGEGPSMGSSPSLESR